MEGSGGEPVASRLSLPTRASTSSRQAARAAPVPRVRELPLVADQWAQEQAKAIEQKTVEPLLSCSVRLAAWADDRRWARARLSGLVGSFAQFHKLAGLDRGREPFAAWRFARRLPARQPPLTLTAAEASALLPLPTDAASAPVGVAGAVGAQAGTGCRGLPGRCPGRAKRPRRIRERGADRRGGADVASACARSDRPRQDHPALQRLPRGGRARLGAAYVEPKGDAIAAIVERVPAERAEDVVLLDFGNELYPPALNLLACRPGDEDVHVEALVGIFRRLFGRFWGPRSEDILRSALATLLANRDPDQQAPTLADVTRVAHRSDGEGPLPGHIGSGRARPNSGGTGGRSPRVSGSRRWRRCRTSCAPSSAGGRCETCSARKTRPTSSRSWPTASCCWSRCHQGRSGTRPT